MDQIRIAVLGPGRISHRFLKGMRGVDDACVTAFATRHPENAAEYTREEGVEKILSYNDMYRDSEIDAVYISTPNYVHAEQIRACLMNGKHVICEKPAFISAADAEELYRLAQEKHLVLMEAQKGMFNPCLIQIREWISSGRIGAVKAAEASYCTASYLNTEHWVMNSPGGGCAFDLGGYPLSALLALFPQEFRTMHRTEVKENGCPVTVSWQMLNTDDILLTAWCSFRYRGDNTLRIYGSEGSIECHEFWKAHHAVLHAKDGDEEFTADFESEFTFQQKHFIELIRNNKEYSPVINPELSIRLTKLLEESPEAK